LRTRSYREIETDELGDVARLGRCEKTWCGYHEIPIWLLTWISPVESEVLADVERRVPGGLSEERDHLHCGNQQRAAEQIREQQRL